MKKIFLALAIALTFASCKSVPTNQQRIEMLQNQYKVVYKPVSREYFYICIDSLNNVYDIRLSYKGTIQSKIKIN